MADRGRLLSTSGKLFTATTGPPGLQYTASPLEVLHTGPLRRKLGCRGS